MAKVKFDVSGSDPEVAASGVGEPPPAGVYTALISECDAGFAKDSDGKPDKNRPRVGVVFAVQDKKYKGFPFWYYLTFGKGFPEQKLDQFLQAVGLANKSKRKGEFDTEKLVGKKVKIQIKDRRKKREGVPGYDPEVVNVMPAGAGSSSEEEGEDLDLEALAEQADAGDDDAASAMAEAASEHELDPDDYDTWAELATAIAEATEVGEAPDDGYDEMTPKALREECKSRSLETTGGKPTLVERLRENDKDDAPF